MEASERTSTKQQMINTLIERLLKDNKMDESSYEHGEMDKGKEHSTLMTINKLKQTILTARKLQTIASELEKIHHGTNSTNGLYRTQTMEKLGDILFRA